MNSVSHLIFTPETQKSLSLLKEGLTKTG